MKKQFRRAVKTVGVAALLAGVLGGSLHYINRNRYVPINFGTLVTDIKMEYLGEKAVKSFSLDDIVREAEQNPERVATFPLSDIKGKDLFVVSLTSEENWCVYCKELKERGWPQNLISRLREEKYNRVAFIGYNLKWGDPLIDIHEGIPRIGIYSKRGCIIEPYMAIGGERALEDTLKVLDEELKKSPDN